MHPVHDIKVGTCAAVALARNHTVRIGPVMDGGGVGLTRVLDVCPRVEGIWLYHCQGV